MMTRSKYITCRGLVATLLLVTLAGCTEVDLYTNLPEKEANEMMAILKTHGIQCTKAAGSEETWKLTVEEAKFSEAVELLSAAGRPRDKFASLGELFQKTGLVSSPTEERIRLTYGLSQELSKTLSMLPGITSARVHIVLPDNDPFGKSIQPASASVVVIHGKDVDHQDSIPLIKEIVVGAIEGLEVDKVRVQVMESAPTLFGKKPRAGNGQPAGADMSEILSIKVTQESRGRFLAILCVAGVAILLAALQAYWSLTGRRAEPQGS